MHSPKRVTTVSVLICKYTLCTSGILSVAVVWLKCGALHPRALLWTLEETCPSLRGPAASERSHTQAPPLPGPGPPHLPREAVRAVWEPLLGPGNTPEQCEHVALCRVDHECRKQAKHAAG